MAKIEASGLKSKLIQKIAQKLAELPGSTSSTLMTGLGAQRVDWDLGMLSDDESEEEEKGRRFARWARTRTKVLI